MKIKAAANGGRTMVDPYSLGGVILESKKSPPEFELGGSTHGESGVRIEGGSTSKGKRIC